MSEMNLSSLSVDAASITDLNAGNVVVTGAARFLQPIHAEPANGENVHEVATTTTMNDSWCLLVSDGSTLKKVTFANFCAAVKNKLDQRSDVTYLTTE